MSVVTHEKMTYIASAYQITIYSTWYVADMSLLFYFVERTLHGDFFLMFNMCRDVPYQFLVELWDVVWRVLSQHREETTQRIPMGLCSRIAKWLVLVQPSWEGHGEVTQGSYSTIPISRTSSFLRAGLLGIWLATSKISHPYYINTNFSHIKFHQFFHFPLCNPFKASK